MYASTSPLSNLPPGPVAGILSASSLGSPFSVSNCCTEGYNGYVCLEALPLEAFLEASDFAGGAEVRSSFGTDAGSLLDSLGASASFLGAGLSSAGISRVLRSSPGSAVTAIRVPTWTALEPSWTYGLD